MTTEKNYFEQLNSVDVTEHIEKKNGLSYLSWAWAWTEVKKMYPDATYTVYENTLPNGYVVNYFTDGKTAYVKTGVTVNGIEHIEYLPVMDHRNKSIKLDQMTSFDVNTAIQRSLTKAVARHGLGLYIYAGEDLPESGNDDAKETTKTVDTPVVNPIKEGTPSTVPVKNGYINPKDIKVADTFDVPPTSDMYSTDKGSITEEQLNKLNVYLAGLTPVTHDKFFKRIDELYGTASIEMLSEQQAYDILSKVGR